MVDIDVDVDVMIDLMNVATQEEARYARAR
jgi:hypothetical protein